MWWTCHMMRVLQEEWCELRAGCGAGPVEFVSAAAQDRYDRLDRALDYLVRRAKRAV